MKKHKEAAEYSARTRVMRILRAIMEQPYRYTKNELADLYAVHRDTITGDFEAIKNAGFVLKSDTKGRYTFVENKPFKQLKDLLHFSEEDQALLHQAIDSLPGGSERQNRLKTKLAALYDFNRLGHSYLRKPYLTKVDRLLEAQKEKKQVQLVGYRSSNSNTVSDRLVEPFHLNPSEDTLQAFDAEKKLLRHFRISRIRHVNLLDTPWQYEGYHNIMRTDPFRIVNNQQESIHLRLKVSAYNELIERYPLTKSYVEETEDPNVFDFQCNVNADYYGLSNFILSFPADQIEVLGPDSLRAHLRGLVERLRF